MKLKIKKNVLGEEYTIYVQIKPNEFECTLRMVGTTKEYSAKINDDFTKIILLEPLVLKGYGAAIPLASGNGMLAGYGKEPEKLIKHIKLSKSNSIAVKNHILDL